jgi:thiosulfate dehydrogenase (quinone) large subunit
VEYGHLLIGLSLVSGLLVRASGPFAILLLLLYWTAHMDFPYIENANSFLIDYHLVYAAVVVELMRKQAGHVFGLDAWAETLPAVQHSALLRWLVGEGAGAPAAA